MNEKRPDPRSFLPLTAHTFQVLLSLADGDKHGYAILKEVGERTSGKVILNTGTLYAVIKRLLSDGLIEEIEVGRNESDSRRRCYRLLQLGRDVALAETDRMEGMLMNGRARRMLRKPHNN